MTQKENNDMINPLLSEAQRFSVEDTLNRMGYACGAAQMNVFVITSSIVITMEFPEEGARTQTEQIRGKVVEMILQKMRAVE